MQLLGWWQQSDTMQITLNDNHLMNIQIDAQQILSRLEAAFNAS